jgi:cytochrome c-type biogenesis protein CcmH/NrfF
VRPAPRSVAILLGAVVMAMAAPTAAPAQCPQTSLADIEDEVTCPVCGVPLELATEAPQAQRQREFIIDRIDRCQSKDEIKAALVAQFGEGVLATPDDEGFDLAAYVLPALAVLIGLGGVALVAFQWRRRRTAATGAAGDAGRGSPSTSDAARLDRDLERYDL